ncbi:MAG TPA: hypothetical protein VK843_10345 [Planctomycetota bacterium]|nr:hypothetical protein [Planctomycetota bacterium]
MSQPVVVPHRSPQARVYLIAAIAAISYGLCARLFFGWPERPPWVKQMFDVMSIAFIFVVPAIIGFLAIYLPRVKSLAHALALPLLPAIFALFLTLLLAWEGLICVAFLLPAVVVLSMLGGLIGWLVVRVQGDAMRGPTIGAVVLLPLLISPLERATPPADELRTVATSIAIAADPAIVWREIASVPEIRSEEHGFAWSHLIGFPRPIAATLSGSGVGAVRHATFERGVLFIEEVTVWREDERLEFTIDADPDTIPAEALDEHVTVGGPHFDVLSGAYAIERLPRGGVVLHLSSVHRLSTTFNRYAGLWSDFTMRDTQQYILEIIKRRCEAAAK